MLVGIYGYLHLRAGVSKREILTLCELYHMGFQYLGMSYASYLLLRTSIPLFPTLERILEVTRTGQTYISDCYRIPST